MLDWVCKEQRNASEPRYNRDPLHPSHGPPPTYSGDEPHVQDLNENGTDEKLNQLPTPIARR